MTGAERKKEAQRRLFLLVAEVQRSEGVIIDGLGPGFRELCVSPDLADLTEEEMRGRLLALVKVATELEC